MAKSQNKAKNIFDIVVHPDIHSEYIAYHKTFDTDRIEWAKENRDKLLRKKTPIEEKKEILFALGHGKDLKALYGIQKYLKNPDAELEAWAFLAWQECQSNVLEKGLEQLFDDESPPLVMTGLGGEGKRLRYCFAVNSKEALSQTQKDTISSVLHVVAKKHTSKTEEIFFGKNYARIAVLVHVDVAVRDLIEDVIADCNSEMIFLYPHYFVVNTSILSESEIEKWIREFA
ncbi:MAG: Uncharacterized protein G01um101448_898 [Parcubacteria group bacterium Gr01-1014_48]|nr:MAG: Uncharacterized protein Greene041614_526 [Parcubacteria group bacterium Greene0416_14]TSC72913.1 MAG: Uncharacterized protein G01um101448_898 [Parcubacteria group bacterium Gr01-1014_48]TSD00541.1 MAG: Uncharacterized protein Greene101415_762 [Parcubacteria group bacterium Greene1014_15]TSD07769.1 MAG: Uncharacterized protein Greene07144_745 [Parcubacteria group bacterium Greene0714_4]